LSSGNKGEGSEGSEGSESSENSESDDDEADKAAYPVEYAKKFLVGGSPFELYKQSVRYFVHLSLSSGVSNPWPSDLRAGAIIPHGFQVFWTCVSSQSSQVSEANSKVSQRCGRKFEARIPGTDRKVAEDFLRRMDWNVKRDGPMVTHYFKSDWLENLLWTLTPSLLGRLSFESSSNQTEAGDLEACSDPHLSQSIPDLANQGKQDIRTKKGHRLSLKDAEENELVFICLFNRRSSSWRLCYAKVRRSSKVQSSWAQERQNRAVNENTDIESQNMDKALFLALREKLLGKRASQVWNWTRWISPMEISALEFWEVRPFSSSSWLTLGCFPFTDSH
jgi:hypothetical protein